MNQLPESFDLSVLWEDSDILAVHKPEGLAAIPERIKGTQNLLDQLSAHFPFKLYVVHRIDKEVSGVILFAKHAAAHKALNTQFSQRQVRKTYLAVTHGIIQNDAGIIDAPIRQFGSGRMGVDSERGRTSQTKFQVHERLEHSTVVHVHPVTGRRHQIRVHLYHLGHPILGDVRYGDKTLQRQYPRVMLHALRITFCLLSGGEMTVEASLPDSFTAVLDAL